jgi:hypothetical protein
MPSLQVLILSAPSGFQQSCILANTLAEENEALFQELVGLTLFFRIITEYSNNLVHALTHPLLLLSHSRYTIGSVRP